jgi:hypothetical protein
VIEEDLEILVGSYMVEGVLAHDSNLVITLDHHSVASGHTVDVELGVGT